MTALIIVALLFAIGGALTAAITMYCLSDLKTMTDSNHVEAIQAIAKRSEDIGLALGDLVDLRKSLETAASEFTNFVEKSKLRLEAMERNVAVCMGLDVELDKKVVTFQKELDSLKQVPQVDAIPEIINKAIEGLKYRIDLEFKMSKQLEKDVFAIRQELDSLKQAPAGEVSESIKTYVKKEVGDGMTAAVKNAHLSVWTDLDETLLAQRKDTDASIRQREAAVREYVEKIAENFNNKIAGIEVDDDKELSGKFEELKSEVDDLTARISKVEEETTGIGEELAELQMDLEEEDADEEEDFTEEPEVVEPEPQPKSRKAPRNIKPGESVSLKEIFREKTNQLTGEINKIAQELQKEAIKAYFKK